MPNSTWHISRLYQAVEDFFFTKGDVKLCSIIRIGFALILLPYVCMIGLNLHDFYGADGLVSYSASRDIMDPDSFSALEFLARSSFALNVCYAIFCINVLLLLLGVFSRTQAALVFFWLVAFQHRNILLNDGEDILARWIAFTLIIMPCGEYFSVDAWRRRLKGILPQARSLLGLRILQIEMTLIYSSTALLKLDGTEWVNGTAVIYAAQLTDVFGRFPLPDFFLSSPKLLMMLTWAVLAVECLIPLGLWFRETRLWAILLGLVLHLSLDYAMNLFLFQWLMMLGLMSFLDLRWSVCKRLINKANAGLVSDN